MQLITETFAGLAIGKPYQYQNLALFPLVRRKEGEADYITLDEALTQGFARVTEVSESGSIPELRFLNESDNNILLLDGEELIGAKQNRVLNITILVGAHKDLTIPVSCVEAGRWGYSSDQFHSAHRAMYAKGRASKMRSVSENMKQAGMCRSDQGEVWMNLSAMEARFDIETPTGAMGDIYESLGSRLDKYTAAFSARDGQCGALFCINGQVAGLEVFDHDDTFKKLMPKLVMSYALDAIEQPGNISMTPTDESAADFFTRVTESDVDSFPSLGEGNDLRLTGRDMVGGALEVDGGVVHLSAFHLESDERSSTDGGRVVSFWERRRKWAA